MSRRSFGPVANRTVLGRLLVAKILVCLRRAPHKLACTEPGLLSGVSCPQLLATARDTAPNGRGRRRRDDAPAARAEPLPSNRSRGACSRSRHDAAATPVVRKKSLLPAWLLESQRSLDAVAASQGEARAGIERLRTSLKCFPTRSSRNGTRRRRSRRGAGGYTRERASHD